jgi:hypothetical protein
MLRVEEILLSFSEQKRSGTFEPWAKRSEAEVARGERDGVNGRRTHHRPPS